MMKLISLSVLVSLIVGFDGSRLLLQICSLPLETGPCRGSFPKYGYNTNTGECEEFIYGGCGGNDNRFDTLTECENECNSGPDCSLVRCAKPECKSGETAVIPDGECCEQCEPCTGGEGACIDQNGQCNVLTPCLQLPCDANNPCGSDEKCVDDYCGGCNTKCEPLCPSIPSPGASCSFTEQCCYGKESCCGETYDSFCCSCSNGIAACYNTDACLGAPDKCPTTKEPVVCTEDAKLCPDGSYVSRDPANNCEFDPCPTVIKKSCIDDSECDTDKRFQCKLDLECRINSCEQTDTVCLRRRGQCASNADCETDKGFKCYGIKRNGKGVCGKYEKPDDNNSNISSSISSGFVIDIESKWVAIFGGILVIVLLGNIILFMYGSQKQSKERAYSVVKGVDSEDFEDSEANPINVN